MLVRLKKNYEFARVFRHGKRRGRKHISLHYRRNRVGCNRVGFTTVKHFGNAVQRNRMRRLMREALRDLAPSLLSGYDIILMGQKSEEAIGFQDVREDLLRILRKEKLLADPEAVEKDENSAD